MTEDNDSASFVFLLLLGGLLLAVTVAAVGWRVAGNGPPLPLSPEPTVVPATAPDASAVPYQSEETP